MSPGIERALISLACTVALVLALVSVADVAIQGRQEARQSHAEVQQLLKVKVAVCSLRDYYAGQVGQSEDFLKLTLQERIKKYGSIGDIPDPAIKLGLTKERQIVRRLSPLVCS